MVFCGVVVVDLLILRSGVLLMVMFLFLVIRCCFFGVISV